MGVWWGFVWFDRALGVWRSRVKVDENFFGLFVGGW